MIILTPPLSRLLYRASGKVVLFRCGQNWTVFESSKKVPRNKISGHGYSTTAVMRSQSNQIEAGDPTDKARIHIIGIGNIGRIFAHSIGRLPNRPPVTLLLHRPSLAEEFQKGGETIEIITNDNSQKVGGFDYEVIPSPSTSFSTTDPIIHNLIVATKCTQTLSALSGIRHRLNAKSTLLFTQNGMGTPELITSSLFPTPEDRPTYLTSIFFHGIHSTGSFSSIHAGGGQGFINISDPMPDTSPNPLSNTSHSPTTGRTSQHKHLLNTVLALPAINAIYVSPSELLLIQLEKLVVNSIINPLTALFRIRNKELYEHPSLEPLIHAMIEEIRAVIIALPELQAVGEEGKAKFGKEELRKLVKDKAIMTATNRSSMLQDTEAGRETEIEFINGWVVRRGRELGVDVWVTEKVVELVKERRVVGVEEVGKIFGV
jgi:2-dehydropantoate 2-reductase